MRIEELSAEADDAIWDEAGAVFAAAWRESHRTFCSAEFVRQHTPRRQTELLRRKTRGGSRLFLLREERITGIVTVKGSLIEDLYVLPEAQGQGRGTRLLRYAMRQCAACPTLWILENNRRARQLYEREGFVPTGGCVRREGGLSELEFAAPAPQRDA